MKLTGQISTSNLVQEQGKNWQFKFFHASCQVLDESQLRVECDAGANFAGYNTSLFSGVPPFP